MTMHQQIRSCRETISSRKVQIASSAALLLVVALAGCQNAQRWSQPGATPSDQYYAPAVSSNGQASGSVNSASPATADSQSWNAATTTAAADGAGSATPTYVASVINRTADIGSPDRAGGGAGVDGGGGRDN